MSFLKSSMVVLLAFAPLAIGCAPLDDGDVGDEENVSEAVGAVENPNGIMPNGIMPNGIMPNGIMPNGIMPNGIMPNGIMPNALAANALHPSTIAASVANSLQDSGA